MLVTRRQFILFLLTGLAGIFIPSWRMRSIATSVSAIIEDVFDDGSIPKAIIEQFSRDFSGVYLIKGHRKLAQFFPIFTLVGDTLNFFGNNIYQIRAERFRSFVVTEFVRSLSYLRKDASGQVVYAGLSTYGPYTCVNAIANFSMDNPGTQH